MKNHRSTQKLVKDLQLLWQKAQISEEIQKIYLESFENLSKSKLHNFLVSEIESFTKNSSPLLLCMSSILAREESILSIKRLNSSLVRTKNWIMLEEVIIECAEIFEAYRNITIELCLNFLKWKKQMKESLGSVNLDFFYEGRSYIGSMETLLDFLLESQFSRVFHFVASDPFLMRCSKITETSQNYLSYKNKYFLTITESTYSKVIEIEKQLFHPPVKITLNKVNSEVKENEKLPVTPSRTPSQKRFHFKEKSSSKNPSTKSINLKKSGFKFIDKVLEEYYLKKENDSRLQINSIEDRSSHSRKEKKKSQAPETSNSRTTQDLPSEVSPEPKASLLKKKLPPLVNPRIKESKSPGSLKPVKSFLEDTETRTFLSVERMVEKMQLCEEVFLSIFKIFLKKSDLYSLAHEELFNARNEKLALIKNELNFKIAVEVQEEILDFYLNCCNLEGLIEEVITSCVENSKVLIRLSENLQLTENFLYEIIETYLKSLNFEEIIEECIDFILETHKNAILALHKVQNLSEKKLNHSADLIIDEFLLKIIHQEIIPSSIEDFKQDQEFDSLNSLKILETFFPKGFSESESISFALFSDSQFSDCKREPRESCREMIEIGSRVVMISALLEFNFDFFSSLPKNRLQRDFIELLRIYSALPQNEKPVKGKSFFITLEIPYKSLKIQDEKFFFIRSAVMTVRNSMTIFEVLTKDRNFSLFFIVGDGLVQEIEKEVNAFQFDLFAKVEAIFSQDYSSCDSRSDILVPFFKKSLTWRVPWIEGLELSKTSHIKSCIESISLNFSSSHAEPTENLPTLKTLSPPFIYGNL